MDDSPTRRSTNTRQGGVQRVGPWHVVAGLVVVVGLAVSTWAAANALRLGERPVTLLPFGDAFVAVGVWGLLAGRLAVVGVVWAVASRVTPRHRVGALAAVGVGWFLWGVWQAWVLLALT